MMCYTGFCNALVQNYLHASIIAVINLYLLFSRELKLSVIIVIALFLQRFFYAHSGHNLNVVSYLGGCVKNFV